MGNKLHRPTSRAGNRGGAGSAAESGSLRCAALNDNTTYKVFFTLPLFLSLLAPMHITQYRRPRL